MALTLASKALAACVLGLAWPQDGYGVRHWDNSTGLPQTSVNALAQDERGFLWLGTFGGLVRFDGFEFTCFDRASPSGSCPNRIGALFCDPELGLWVGSEDGGLVQQVGERFERRFDGEIMALGRTVDARLVLVRPDGLWWSDARRETFERDERFADNEVEHMIAAGGLVCALTKREVLVHQGQRWRALKDELGQPLAGMLDAAVDPDGTLWLRRTREVLRVEPAGSTARGVARFEAAGHRVVRDGVGGTWCDVGGRFLHWSGAPKDASRESEASRAVQRPVGDLRAALVDRDGNLWIGSASGLTLAAPAELELHDEQDLDCRRVGPLLACSDGGLWLGGDRQLLKLHQGRLLARRQASEIVRALAFSPDRKLWALEGRDIVRYDTRSRLVVGPPPALRDSAYLRALWIDADATLWAGGTHGLLELRQGTWRRYGRADGPGDEDVLCIQRDVSGRLWVCTAAGASLLVGERFRTEIVAADGLPVPVRSIASAPDGSVWLATYGTGLCRWREGERRWFTSADGLPDNNVSALLLDSQGRIAISTNRGLAEAQIDLLDGDGSAASPPQPWIIAAHAPGRAVVEAQGGHQPAGCVTSDGSRWFAVVGGLAQRRAPALRAAPRPRASVVGLVSSAGVAHGALHELPLGVRSFQIDFTAPSFVQPDQLRFRYRLLPMEERWSAPVRERSVAYQLLPPGNYEFQVAACAPGQAGVEGFDRLSITLPPRWSERPLVRFHAAALVLLALGLGWRARLASLRRRQAELQTLVQHRTRELADEVAVRAKAEHELRQHRDALDRRVQERTAELVTANMRLEQELEQRERMQRDLRQAQKMESMGRLAGSIAHDFNNLLMVINGAAEQAAATSAAVGQGPNAWSTVAEAGRTGAHLTRQLLTFARRHPIEPALQRVEASVLASRELLKSSLGAQVELEFALEQESWPVSMQNGHLEQILLNLCINARDAMPAGGRVTIATARRTLGPSELPSDVPPGDFVELSVADNGMGMSDETAQRALDPYFSTKAQGTGLGLSTCYGIARQAGGTLLLESTLHQGTRVRVLLRRHLLAPRASSVLTPKVRALAVLVVDDQPGVREVVEAMLTRAGHRVTSLGSGAEAVRLVEARPHDFDVALLDVSMPGLSGPETAARLERLAPRLAVVFMSGSIRSAEPQGWLDAREPLLDKPFTLEALESALRKALQRAREECGPPTATEWRRGGPGTA